MAAHIISETEFEIEREELRHFKWSDASVFQFIRLRRELDNRFTGKRGSAREGWTLVAQALGLVPAEKFCKVLQKKWQNLLQKYKEIRDKFVKETEEKKQKGDPLPATIESTWPFYHVLAELLENVPNHIHSNNHMIEAGGLSFPEGLDMCCEDSIETFSPPEEQVVDLYAGSSSGRRSKLSVPASMPETGPSPAKSTDGILESQLLRIMETASDSIASLGRQAAQQQQQQQQQLPPENQDEAYFYAMSIVPRLRQLPGKRLHLARLKIEQILCEIEND